MNAIQQIDVDAEDGLVFATGYTDRPDDYELAYVCSFVRTVAGTPQSFDADELDEWSVQAYRSMAECIFTIHQGLEV